MENRALELMFGAFCSELSLNGICMQNVLPSSQPHSHCGFSQSWLLETPHRRGLKMQWFVNGKEMTARAW